MAVTYTNCTYDETDHSITPSVSTTALSAFITILEDGLYTEDVSSYITTMASASSVEDSMTTFLTYVVPSALFLNDVTSAITTLTNEFSVTNLVAVLDEMFFVNDMSASIESFASGYYQEASVTITGNSGTVISVSDNCVVGNAVAFKMDSECDLTIDTVINFVPTNDTHNVTDVSYSCGILKTQRFNGSLKKGYNKAIWSVTKPTVKDVTDKAVSLGYSKKTWFVKNLSYFRLHDDSSERSATGCIITYTFSTKLWLLGDETSSFFDYATLSAKVNYNFDQLCGTDNTTTVETVDSLSTSLSNISTELANATTVTSEAITSFESDWAQYSSSYTPTVYSYGNMVMFNGGITNSSAVTSSADEVQVMTLPDGYAPIANVRVLCQGSTTYHWLMTINTSGEVYISRYGGNGSYTDLTTNRWLVFNAVWITDGSSS